MCINAVVEECQRYTGRIAPSLFHEGNSITVKIVVDPLPLRKHKFKVNGSIKWDYSPSYLFIVQETKTRAANLNIKDDEYYKPQVRNLSYNIFYLRFRIPHLICNLITKEKKLDIMFGKIV